MGKKILKGIVALIIAAVVMAVLSIAVLSLATVGEEGEDNIARMVIDRFRERNSTPPVLTDEGRSIQLLDQIIICQNIKVEGGTYSQGYIERHGGLLVFHEEANEETAIWENAIDNENVDIYKGLAYREELHCYARQTDGIKPKDYHEPMWLRCYLRLADGSFIYSPLKEFSIALYCEHKIELAEENPEDEQLQRLKRACEAILEYGEAATEYLEGKEE